MTDGRRLLVLTLVIRPNTTPWREVEAAIRAETATWPLPPEADVAIVDMRLVPGTGPRPRIRPGTYQTTRPYRATDVIGDDSVAADVHVNFGDGSVWPVARQVIQVRDLDLALIVTMPGFVGVWCVR